LKGYRCAVPEAIDADVVDSLIDEALQRALQAALPLGAEAAVEDAVLEGEAPFPHTAMDPTQPVGIPDVVADKVGARAAIGH